MNPEEDSNRTLYTRRSMSVVPAALDIFDKNFCSNEHLVDMNRPLRSVSAGKLGTPRDGFAFWDGSQSKTVRQSSKGNV